MYRVAERVESSADALRVGVFIKGVPMLAYIDAGTAAAIAAMATGGMAGAKVAAQSFFYGRRGKKTDAAAQAETVDHETEDLSDDFAETYIEQQAA